MAISKIASAGVATDTLTAADLAPDSVGASEIAASAVGISELDNAATGVDSTHHKVPAFADDAARNTAIPSPANGMIIYNTNSGALQQYNGVWSTIAPAPNITALSGFLNNDTDSTITIFGTNFTSASSVKMFTASSGGSQIGSNATTTFNTNVKLTAVFGAGSIGASGSTAYIEVDNAGATNRFATAITVNADPTVVHAGATGASANTTTHLGTYGGLTAGGPADSDTTLLLNFDRGGGLDIEDSSNTGGDGHRFTLNGDAKIKASPFGDGKTAMKFPGASGDRLSIGAHADWNFADGDATMECWVFPTNGAATAQRLLSSQGGSFLWIFWWGRQAGKFTFKSTNVADTHSTSTFSTYAWHHVAVVKTGTNARDFKLYVNGRLELEVTASGDFADTVATLVIGEYSGDGEPFHGFMDEVRISKGIAVYTGNFTVPTARFSGSGQSAGASGSNIVAVTAAQTKLLIHSNLSATSTSFADSATTGTTHVPTSTNVIHSTLYNVTESTVLAPALAWPASGKAIASYGAYFDGNDSIQIDNNDDAVDFGTANFTIDFWAKATSLSAQMAWISRRDDSQNSIWYISALSSTQIRVGLPNASGSIITYDFTYSLGTTAWHHIALVRSSAVIKLYVDGTQVGSNITVVHNMDTANAADGKQVQLGRALIGNSWVYPYTGYLDVIRISNGTAHWTTAFTPETLLYGSAATATIPTITFTGSATQLAGDEDIEFTSVVNPTKAANNQHLTDSGIGLVLTNVADSNTATLTGTIASAAGTTHSNMAVKAQVRKSLGDAAYNNSTLVTFSGSTTTAGLAPGMPVTGTGISVAGPLTCGLTNADATVTAASTTGLVVGMQVNAFTGVPAGATILSIITNTSFELSANATATDADAKLTFNTIISAVASATTLTLSNVTTSGNQTGNTLIFEDLTRVTHINGADVLAGGDAMMTIASGAGGDPVLFNARRYAGNQTAGKANSGFGFAPDMIWFKWRNAAWDHHIFDSVRGVHMEISPNTTGIEATETDGVTSFDKDGFTMGNDAGINNGNAADQYIAWGWKAGGAPSSSALSIDADGFGAGTISDTGSATTITSSVNQTGGFSITRFTGSASGITLPHNLGGTPSFIIVKRLGTGDNWYVWHQNLGSGIEHIYFNDGAEVNDSGSFSNIGATTWGCGSTDGAGGGSGAYICYAWKAVAGVSHFGTYTGNGGSSTKTITGVGFSPKYLMIKCNSDASTRWVVHDTFRGITNRVYPERTQAEESDTAGVTYSPTLTSDGFEFPTTVTHENWNGNDNTYIYCAFA